MGFFTPNYPKTILFLAGVIIGITTSFNDVGIKLGIFVVGMVLVFISEYLRKKEEE